jgi:hypothetical protein
MAQFLARPLLRYGLLGLSALLLTASPAFAETDISGRWLFKTDTLPGKGCVISGEIEFHKTAAPLGYACTFLSREDCRHPSGDTFTEVRQSCIAIRSGETFVISSKVETITDAGPADFRKQMMESMAYAPDNFRVTVTRPDELKGLFYSMRQAAVRFWRDEELIS